MTCSNLVNANHVIFVAPLLAETQYNYDSAMAQAIARCRRYRQKKKVQIYHFAALGTIDVDILEHRHKRVDAIYDSDTTVLFPITPSQKKEKTRIIEIEGGMALLPKSWLEHESIRNRLGITQGGKRFGSAIEFSETFRDND
jgi:SNF2 family DNA or RNA helicase